MWARILLTAGCLLMIGAAIRFDPSRQRSLLASHNSDGPRLRLITWNIGYAELEDDSRAHTKDLQAVADTILTNDPDAVALQELTGAEQLKVLLGYLRGRYSGAVAPLGTPIASQLCSSKIATLVLNLCQPTENTPLRRRFIQGRNCLRSCW